jgi:hypothetical protein
MTHQPPDLLQKLHELSSIYNQVKRVILRSEYEGPHQKYLLASANEIRNAFDHVMRAVSGDSNIEGEFKEARAHLYRAGYDAYEIMAMNMIEDIHGYKKDYGYEVIVAACPEYNTSIVPLVNEIKKELSEVRSTKPDVKSNSVFFNKYTGIIERLQAAHKQLNDCIPKFRTIKSTAVLLQEIEDIKKEYGTKVIVDVCKNYTSDLVQIIEQAKSSHTAINTTSQSDDFYLQYSITFEQLQTAHSTLQSLVPVMLEVRKGEKKEKRGDRRFHIWGIGIGCGLTVGLTVICLWELWIKPTYFSNQAKAETPSSIPAAIPPRK